jgi:hypothetical protein
MQAPKGPGLSHQEILQIQKEFSAKPKKRKHREMENSVSVLKLQMSGKLT